MVVVSTPSKTRICLDPQDLNKAVIRPKNQMSTLDELLPTKARAGKDQSCSGNAKAHV